jgi:hypothetical protein
MSAEGLLDNPALFAPALTQMPGPFEELDEGAAPPSSSINKLDLAIEYLDLVDRYPVKMK